MDPPEPSPENPTVVGSADAGADTGISDAALEAPADAGLDVARYRDALALGRKETLAKHYPQAVAAFDEALAVNPGDPRALAERGYAHFLAKELVLARTDLDRAADHTRDKKLRAQIYFNLGLVAEAQDDDAQAYYAFSEANALNPTAYAAARVDAGKGKETSLCGASVDFKRRPMLHVATWFELGDVMAPGASASDGEAPVCLEACGALFRWDSGSGGITLPKLDCTSTCEGSKNPFFVVTKGFRHGFGLVVPSAGELDVFPLTEVGLGRCGPGVIEATLVREASYLHAHVVHRWIMATPMCQKDGALTDCTGAAGETSAGTACGANEVRDVNDYWFEPAKKLLVATVEPPSAPPVSIHASTSGLVFSGKACDRTLPWP